MFSLTHALTFSHIYIFTYLSSLTQLDDYHRVLIAKDILESRLVEAEEQVS